MINKFRKIAFLSLIPFMLVVVFVAYKHPQNIILRHSNEILFLYLLLFSVVMKFKVSSNLYYFLGLGHLLISTVFFVLNYDGLTVAFTNLALVLFIIGVICQLLYLRLYKNPHKVDRKVIFIANAIVGKNPGVSGGESRFIELGKQWISQGYDIHLLAAESGKTLCEKMGMPVFLHKLSSSNNDNRLEFIIRTLQVLVYLPVLAVDFQEGVVYSTSEQIYDVLPGSFLKLIYPSDIVFVSAVHWLPPILFWKRKSSRPINSFLFLVSERVGLILAYLSTDALFPVSQSTYNDMEKNGLLTCNTHVVKCGVNLDEIKTIRAKYNIKKYDAVFMKRIQSVKGIFDLIDIWELVVKKLPNATLIIIGSGIDEERAKQTVIEKELENNIKFLGVIYDAESKFRNIAESKLFLLPSYEENWAIVIGEAMAAGLPVICYDLKELLEVWQDSVCFIPLGDKNKYADLVVEFLRNEDKYEAFMKDGINYIQKYDWKLIAREEMEVISSTNIK